VERLAGMVVFWIAEAGEFALPAFLIRRVTPPSAPGWIPMAYPECQSCPYVLDGCAIVVLAVRL
jgi:hypothetical protein